MKSWILLLSTRSQRFHLLFGQILSGFLTLISVTLTARFCGPTIFSLLSGILIAGTFLVICLDFGACTWGARQLQSNLIQAADFYSIMFSKIKLSCIFSFLFSVLIYYQTKSIVASVLGLLYTPGAMAALYYQTFFLLEITNHSNLVKLQITERILWLTSIPLFLLGFTNEVIFVLPILLGLTSNLMLGPVLARYSLRGMATHPFLSGYEIFSKSRHFGVSTILNNSAITDTVLVTSLIGSTASAGYVLGQRFRNPLALGFQAYFARIRPTLVTKDFKQIIRTVKRELPLIYLNILGLFLAVLIIATNFELLFGSLFSDLRLEISLCFISTIFAGLKHIFLSSMDVFYYEKWKMLFLIVCIPVQLLSISIAAVLFGSLGAAFALLGSSSLISFVAGLKVVHIIKSLGSAEI